MSDKKIINNLWLELKTILKKIPKVWRVVLGISGVLATISGVLSFFPSIDVDIGEPFDPNNPFTAPVMLTNDGLLCLNSIINVTKLKILSDPTGKAIIIEKYGITSTELIKKLCKDETSTFGLSLALKEIHKYTNFSFNQKPDYGDIVLEFSFRQSFTFWRQTISKRFAFTLKNNKYTWFPRALTDKLR